MQEYLRNAGIFLGHVICVLILLYCFVSTNEIIPEEDKTVHVEGFPSIEPTAAPTTPPGPTEISIQTTTPVPSVTLTPTITPTPVMTENPSPAPTQGPVLIPVAERDTVKQKVQENIAAGIYAELNNNNDSWWFRRKENHVPSGSGELFDISKYQGFYLNKEVSEEDKVIYLTIDCGYGSNNTAVFLDILKKHDVQVTFFVTDYFLKANPKEVCRMAEEGHLVGNHSVTHSDLTGLTEEEIYSEIIGCEEAYYNLTGKDMDLFFRPPGGDYSIRTMQITKDLGYNSIFWSVAYFDYDQSNQPGKQYVLDHFEQYHHNGAIVLMHNDSRSNRDAIEDVILYLKQQGYRFGSLEELIK